MSKYLLLIRGEDKWAQLSPAEMQETLQKYMVWAKKLREEGRIEAAEPLEPTGRTLSGEGGSITDGPYVETKEAIGGFFLYTAADMEEAVEIAKGCPALGYGGAVEVRPVAVYN